MKRVARPLTRTERIAWARLARTPQIGPISFARLLDRFGSPAAALDELPTLSRGRFCAPSTDEIEAEFDALERLDARLLAACEPDYPALLAALDPGPAMIAVRGDVALLQRPTVAIVGARDASAAGLRLAGDFARGLGELGFVVVSGLARGIDTEAHTASLSTGTVAVLAGGLDRPYPPQNLALFEAISERGCAVTEAPIGFQARARDFPRRNHIISGLSRGVLVVEAALRSGSLITANAAADQGREVLAAPGSPLDHRFRGANALIKSGATLVETAEDVAEALGTPTPPGRRQAPLLDLESSEVADEALIGRIGQLLSPTPVHFNEIARRLSAPLGAVSAAVLELELMGRAASLPGGYVASAGAAFGS